MLPVVVFVDPEVGPADLTGRHLAAHLPLASAGVLGTYAEARQQLPVLAPQLVIFEARLDPPRSGLELLGPLRAQLPHTRWLLYSGNLSALLVQEAADLGADGTVAKQCCGATLTTAVEHVLAGRRFQCEHSSRLWRTRATLPTLLPTERRILTAIAHGLEPKDIAAHLGLAHKTVLNDLVGLRRKTRLHSMVALAKFAAAHGLAAPL